MRELFIYYRIRNGAEAAARSTLATMQDALRTQQPGLIARRLARRDESGRVTWMETYAMPPGTRTLGIDAILEDAIASLALPLAPFIEGARHVEAFESDD